MRANIGLVDVTPQAEAGLTSTCSTLWMGGVARLLRDELWHCMTRKERRLYEQGVSVNRLRQYLDRWCCWLWGGLGGLVSRQGGAQKYWQSLQTQTTLNSKKNQTLPLTG